VKAEEKKKEVCIKEKEKVEEKVFPNFYFLGADSFPRRGFKVGEIARPEFISPPNSAQPSYPSPKRTKTPATHNLNPSLEQERVNQPLFHHERKGAWSKEVSMEEQGPIVTGVEGKKIITQTNHPFSAIAVSVPVSHPALSKPKVAPGDFLSSHSLLSNHYHFTCHMGSKLQPESMMISRLVSFIRLQIQYEAKTT
jgi:hypothetical protein